MSTVYDLNLREQILNWSKAHKLGLKQGVYLATTGPSFETPAEIRAFARLGADAVGMSTVPEAIVARQLGCGWLGFPIPMPPPACRTGLSHEEVSATAERVRLNLLT